MRSVRFLGRGIFSGAANIYSPLLPRSVDTVDFAQRSLRWPPDEAINRLADNLGLRHSIVRLAPF
jgi:hypothetical protein